MTTYDFESGTIPSVFDIKTSIGSCGIKNNNTFAGSYCLGSDQGPGEGISGISPDGQYNGLTDQNHIFLKLPDSPTCNFLIQMKVKRWSESSWQGHFCGFGMGGNTELIDITYDNTYHSYSATLQRVNTDTINIVITIDGATQLYTGNIAFTYTASGYIPFGIQTRHNGAGDNSCYFRMDDVIGNDLEIAPVANFTWSPISPIIGQPIQFRDTSGGPAIEWTWNFGAGNSNNTQNPLHTFFGVAGDHPVYLLVSNELGTDNITKIVTTRSDTDPYLKPTWDFIQVGGAGLPTSTKLAQFVCKESYVNRMISEGYTISNYSWDFGDGQTGSNSNMSAIEHTYANYNNGVTQVYFVTLTVTINNSFNIIGNSLGIQMIAPPDLPVDMGGHVFGIY